MKIIGENKAKTKSPKGKTFKVPVCSCFISIKIEINSDQPMISSPMLLNIAVKWKRIAGIINVYKSVSGTILSSKQLA